MKNITEEKKEEIVYSEIEDEDVDSIIGCGLDPTRDPLLFEIDVRAAVKYINENNIKNGLSLEELERFRRND